MAYTQKQLILQYMDDFGSVTTMEAFMDLGITKLTTRISELRAKGYEIKSEKVRQKNRYGKDVTFYRYRRVRDEKQAG